ncbi:hypothetical protein ACIQM0_26945 [Streptomyces sp. NPDC091387]|uniref:hypothetical protein n=1 Tax=Streptomyces sp. NPDC091387 TaxID=3365998 RepID=UPI003813E25C
MSATHAWRFAPDGLLERRRSVPDADGRPSREIPQRPVTATPWLPETQLPPGLLPLPSGYELRAAAPWSPLKGAPRGGR